MHDNTKCVFLESWACFQQECLNWRCKSCQAVKLTLYHKQQRQEKQALSYHKTSLHHDKELSLQVIANHRSFADPRQAIAHSCCLLEPVIPVSCALLQRLK